MIKKIKTTNTLEFYSINTDSNAHIPFIDSMVRLDDNENIDQALKRMEEEASVTLAFGQDPKPEEAATEDIPVEEEASAEEEVKEQPAEEPQEEAPVEEEAPAEEAPTEEVPAEEEIPAEQAQESVPEEDSAEKADESSKE